MCGSKTLYKNVQHSQKCTLMRVPRLGLLVAYSSLSDLLIWERRFVPTPTVRLFRRGSSSGSKFSYCGKDSSKRSSRKSAAQTTGRSWRARCARCANTVK